MGALVQAGVDADFDDAHVGAVEVGRQPFGADQRTFGNGRIGMGRAADQGRDVQHGAGTLAQGGGDGGESGRRCHHGPLFAVALIARLGSGCSAMQCRQGRAGSQLRNPQMDMRRQGMDSGTPGSLLPSGAYVSAPVSRRRASAAGHVPRPGRHPARPAAGASAAGHRSVPARPALDTGSLLHPGVPGAAHADGLPAGLRLLAAGLGAAVRPLRAQAHPAGRHVHLCAGGPGQRQRRDHGIADRLARAAGCIAGRRRDVRARHGARPVRSAPGRPGHVQGADRAGRDRLPEPRQRQPAGGFAGLARHHAGPGGDGCAGPAAGGPALHGDTGPHQSHGAAAAGPGAQLDHHRAPPGIPVLPVADLLHLCGPFHQPGRIFLHLYPCAGRKPHGLRPADGQQCAVLHRGHLPVPLAAAAHGCAARRADCRAGQPAVGHVHRHCGAGRCAQPLGLCPALLYLPDRPWRAHALRPEQCHRALPAVGGHGLGAQRLHHDAHRLCHGTLAGSAPGRPVHPAHGLRHLVLGRVHGPGRLGLVRRHGRVDGHR